MAADGFELNVNYSQVEQSLLQAASRALQGSAEASQAACEVIKSMSLAEVPEDTGTLASSFSYDVQVHGEDVIATLGYGLENDPTNPKTGKAASEYMIAVHEDLSAPHPKGKAKFLEDPVNWYTEQFLPNAASIIKGDLG
jgi:hypothetical protein